MATKYNMTIEEDRKDTLHMLNKYIYMVDINLITGNDAKYFGRANEEYMDMLHNPQYYGENETICKVMRIMEKNNISW